MKIAVREKDRRLYLLAGELYSAARIGAWCYSREKKLFYSTEPHWEGFQSFLILSGILDRVVADESEDPLPSVRSDELGLQWITEKVNTDDGGEIFIIIGPVFIQSFSKEVLMKKLSGEQLSLAVRSRYSRLLEDVPIIDGSVLGGICRMLHFTIYDEYMGSNEMHFEMTGEMRKTQEREEPDCSDRIIVRNYTGDAQLEKTLLDCVKNGEYREEKAKDGERSGYGGRLFDFGLEDDLRTVKDNMIIFIDKCMRAAMEGGLPTETAFGMESDAIRNIEKARTIAEAANRNWDAFLGYVESVRKVREASAGGISRSVLEAMQFIRTHMREEIGIPDVARHCGYAEYYLSRKFTKETGMKVQDYIREVRIDMAKVELITSKKGISEIAEGLQFKSRSHFDRSFVAQTGMTPAKYRETSGQILAE